MPSAVEVGSVVSGPDSSSLCCRGIFGHVVIVSALEQQQL